MDRFKDLFNDFDSFFNDFNSFLSKGKTNTEKGSDEKGDWVKQTFTSDDGLYQSTTFIRTSNSKLNSKSDLGSISKVDELKNQLGKHIQSQEFEKAAELRDKIKAIESNNEKINSLKEELDKVIKEQNFEKAIEIRDKIKKIE